MWDGSQCTARLTTAHLSDHIPVLLQKPLPGRREVAWQATQAEQHEPKPLFWKPDEPEYKNEILDVLGFDNDRCYPTWANGQAWGIFADGSYRDKSRYRGTLESHDRQRIPAQCGWGFAVYTGIHPATSDEPTWQTFELSSWMRSWRLAA